MHQLVTGLFILECNERISNYVTLEQMIYETLLEQKESHHGMAGVLKLNRSEMSVLKMKLLCTDSLVWIGKLQPVIRHYHFFLKKLVAPTLTIPMEDLFTKSSASSVEKFTTQVVSLCGLRAAAPTARDNKQVWLRIGTF